MTTFAPRRQLPIAAGHGAPLRMPFTGAIPTSAPSPAGGSQPATAVPTRGRLAQLLAGLRRRPAALISTTTIAPIDRVHDAVYRDDDGGWGDDGGWD